MDIPPVRSWLYALRMTDAQPRYRRIAEDMAAEIAAGTFPVGELLPSKRSISEDRHVSVGTVDRAIGLLIGWGLIRGRQGIGYEVVSRDRREVRSAADELTDIKARLDRIEQHLGIARQVPG